MTYHTPVLYNEVLEILVSHPDGVYVDCTMGEGGHSLGILEKLSPLGRLVSLDQDLEMMENSLEKFPNQPRWTRIGGNFRNLEAILKSINIEKVDGILADLGLSMFHYKASSKGFSFSKDDLLDMSFQGGSGFSARDIVNYFSLDDIQNILWKYGEEPNAHRIASFILFYRENVGIIETTKQLSDIIYKASISLPGRKKSHLHPATKTFQALRIVVNDELGALQTLLISSLNLLNKGGRGVFISYHSLEDRQVKQFFTENRENIKVFQKKPIIPSEEEVMKNKASRSAKLRFFER